METIHLENAKIFKAFCNEDPADRREVIVNFCSDPNPTGGPSLCLYFVFKTA
jgi:hypothetical protein